MKTKERRVQISAPRINFQFNFFAGSKYITRKMDCDKIIQEKVNVNARLLSDFVRSACLPTGSKSADTNLIDMAIKRTYSLTGPDVDQFFALLEQCRADKTWPMALHFAELQPAVSSGIMLDFDIYQTVAERIVPEEAIRDIIMRYMELLGEVVDIAANMTSTSASQSSASQTNRLLGHVAVIMKPEPKKDQHAVYGPCYKDGLHILIPQIWLPRSTKKYLIRRMTDDGMIDAVMDEYGVTGRLCGAQQSILDPMSASVPVLFLGSCKPGAKVAYPLRYVYQYKLLYAAARTRCDLQDVTAAQAVNPNIIYNLSLSFAPISAAFWPKQEYGTKAADTAIAVGGNEDQFGLFRDNVAANVAYNEIGRPDLTFYKKLLLLLDPAYYMEYAKWRDVIFALGNAGGQSFKVLAIEFSLRAGPQVWSESAFESLWAVGCSAVGADGSASSADGKVLTKASLFYWAQQCQPEAWQELRTSFYFNKLMNYIFEYDGTIEHDHIAAALYEMMSNKFVTDVVPAASRGAPTRHCWFELIMPDQGQVRGEVYKWRDCGSEPAGLFIYVSGALDSIYKELLAKIKTLSESAPSEAAAKYFKKVEKNFKMYRSKLGNSAFRRGIIEAAKYRFMRHGFIAGLDAQANVLGVGNGLLRLGREPALITSFHEYALSKYTDTIYRPFDASAEPVRVLLKAFRDIFIEPDVFEFMMMYYSTALEAHETEPMVVFLVAGGQNGKSFSAEMVAKCIGKSYAAKLPMSLLTADRENSESANSAMMHIKNKRFCRFSEPQRIETINTGRLKELTGGEDQSGRQLYGQQEDFMVSATFIVLSNYTFHINTTDHGTWRRIYMYHPKVKFCERPDPSNPYERQEDTRFARVFKNNDEYKSAMLSILVHYNQILHVKYGGEVRRVPCQTIKNETEAFRNQQDSIHRFIKVRLVRVDGPAAALDEAQMSIEHLARAFLVWYRETVDEKSKLTLKDVAAQLVNSYLEKFVTKRGEESSVRGWRLRTIEEQRAIRVGALSDQHALGPSFGYDENGITVENKWLEADDE
jgi:phage/plasmid-associated DNA primase